ncbi:hypothetical protein EYF80_012888 [Liparis tanakae]|uniref:Uncharacterized protein n=1 Tax=Liparis tanakae TaxID=230148 RepID=A0A4Z2IGM4_9TELE|nr:hypothetical protein EYF80_012888 [Liparis tanakae]
MEAKERRDEPRREHEGHEGTGTAVVHGDGPQGTAPAENPRESDGRMEPKEPSILLSRHAPRRTHVVQKKEWTWDESKMMVMQDPIYRCEEVFISEYTQSGFRGPPACVPCQYTVL